MAILEFVSECACKIGRRRSAVSYLSNYRSYKPTHDACSTNHIAEDEQYDRSSWYDGRVAWSLVNDADFAEPVVRWEQTPRLRQSRLVVHLRYDHCTEHTLHVTVPITSAVSYPLMVTAAANRRPAAATGATGVSPLPAPGSGTACRRNCDGQTLSLANSVDYWRHFCLRRDSRDGGALVTVIVAPCISFSYYYYYYYCYYYYYYYYCNIRNCSSWWR